MIYIVYDRERIKKNKDFAEMLIKMLQEQHILAKLVFVEDIKKSQSLLGKIDFPKLAIMRTDDFKTSKFLEENNVLVCNNSVVSEICNDKFKTYLFLKQNNIDVIDTMLYDNNFDYNYPIVIKSRYGHGGSEVFLAHNKIELQKIVQNFNEKSLIVQPLVDQGKDKRTYVIGNKIILSMLRTNKNDFRSNFSLGGNAEKSTLSESEKNLIDSVLKVLKFDFAGIDIIYKNNRPYINEIEDVVGSRMVYANTDIDIIKLYLDYIKEKYENE